MTGASINDRTESEESKMQRSTIRVNQNGRKPKTYLVRRPFNPEASAGQDDVDNEMDMLESRGDVVKKIREDKDGNIINRSIIG